MNQIKEKPQLTYIEALKNALDKIIQIQGRSRRSEYWWTRGTVFLVSIVLARLFSPFGLLVLNLLTIPLTFRRLHDTGRSGWWLGVSILLRCSLTVIFIADIFQIASAGIHDADIDIYRIDAMEAAGEMNNAKAFNMIVLGGFLKVRPIVTLENVLKGLKKTLPERHHDLIPMNEAALRKGMDIISLVG